MNIKTECLIQCDLSANNLITVNTHLNLPFFHLWPTLLPVLFGTTRVRLGHSDPSPLLAVGWVWLHETSALMAQVGTKCTHN